MNVLIIAVRGDAALLRLGCVLELWVELGREGDAMPYYRRKGSNMSHLVRQMPSGLP